MTENQAVSTPAHESAANEHAHHGPDHRTYLMVFVALSILTGMSFGAYEAFGRTNPTAGLIAIMLISLVKAYLVASIFMHLKWDWANLYFLIIPALILGVLIIVVLLPDIVYLPY